MRMLGLDYDAVTLKNIVTKFVFSNRSLQNEFDAEIQHSNLAMTMVGNECHRHQTLVVNWFYYSYTFVMFLLSNELIKQ